MKAKRFTALLAAASAVAFTPRAAAQEHAPVIAEAHTDETSPQLHLQPETPARHKPASIALLLGYGATLDDGRTVAGGKAGNGFGVGFGAAAGYDLSAFYVGARFMFFLGGAAHVGDVVVSRKQTTLGLEAGIPLDFTRLTLRPQVGFGLAIESAERERRDAGGDPVTADDSSEDIYVAPGIAALYAIHDAAFIGVDAQVPLIITDSTLIGLAVLGSAGMRF